MNDKEYGRIIAKNLKNIAYMRQKTQADISKDLSISKATVSSWFNGTRIPRMDKVDAMCAYLKCTRSDIMDAPLKVQTVSAVRIPVLGHVAAGIPISAITDILDWEEIPEAMANGGEYYGLRLQGDSMSPEMRSGDVVIVRSQPDAETGDIVVVQVNGDSEATCKRLVKYDNGIILMSINPDFPPMQFTAEEIIKSPVHVIGKVVEVRRKM